MVRHLSFFLLAAVFTLACTEPASDVTAPGELGIALKKPQPTLVVEPVCQVIDFNGFSHGDLITTVASGFGFDITLALTPGGPTSTNNLRAWDTDTPESPGIQDVDLMWDGPNTTCAACNGQGKVLIIEDRQGFNPEGDSSDGGDIDMTGFAGNGTFIVRSYVAIDQEGTEDAIRLFVDGTEDGASSGLGDGSVETVTPNQQTFTETVRFRIDGSGAVDDIEICQGAENANGRMTGGGGQINIDGVRITRGFTIHCDITLSNNLEINWAGGNKWHLDKPLTSAECFDDEALDPVPPAAPFDTFIGEGVGRLNGVPGSIVRFTFIDDGEPGRDDHATIQLWAPGDDPDVDTPVLEVSDFLARGNIQAHFDQPHK